MRKRLNTNEMITLTLILLVVVISPLIYFCLMLCLELLADLLFLVVRALDYLTGNKKRLQKDKDNDNGFR